MHRESILIAFGVLIAIIPYLGLPYTWLMVILPVLGLVVLAIGLSLRMRRRRNPPPATPTHEANPSV